MDDYYSEENLAKRELQYGNLKNIEDQIMLLQKQYNQLTEEYSKDNYDIRSKYIIYTIIDTLTVPYGFNTEGPTHIGDIVESFEDSPGWVSSSARCE